MNHGNKDIAICNAYRLALVMDETGSGSTMCDEIIAILASQIPDPVRAALIKEVQDEYGDWRENHPGSMLGIIHRPPAPVTPIPIRFPSGKRSFNWFVLAYVIAFLGISGSIVRCTTMPRAPAPAAPAIGVPDRQPAAAGAIPAAIPSGVAIRVAAPPGRRP